MWIASKNEWGESLLNGSLIQPSDCKHLSSYTTGDVDGHGKVIKTTS